MAVPKFYENPLLGHARMRAMYRALVETRALSEQAGKKFGLPRKLEACWVGTAIDLGPGDLVSGLHAGVHIAFIRAVGTRKSDRAVRLTEFRRAAEAVRAAKPFSGAASDAVCCAVGQATALMVADGKQVTVVYAGVDALTPAEWKRVLTVANDGALPLVVVAIPVGASEGGVLDLSAVAAKVAEAKIPVIPVDAADVVALYRVMQETCLRARADGGVVVIECVRSGTDPVQMLATQLQKKGICTERWISRVTAGADTLGRSRHASSG